MLLTSLCAAALTLNSTECLSQSAEYPTSLQSNAELATKPSSKLSTMAASQPEATASKAAKADYWLGVGKADITGPAAETGMFGYAAKQQVNGINDRLYSRAFIIAESDQSEDKRIVYVSTDLGAMFTAVKLEVIKRLQAEFGDLYRDENVMLTATHTHVGNGGFSHQKLYQMASTDDTLAGSGQSHYKTLPNRTCSR